MLLLLIKAGYVDDIRTKQAFDWLLSMRQKDGGWVIGSPGMISRHFTMEEKNKLTSDVTYPAAQYFNASKPFSAAGTGMVLRAFAEHPRNKQSAAAQKAAQLLNSKLFKKDNWSSYQHPDNWLRFQYPFWWTNLISALDTLSKIGVPKTDPHITHALNWLIDQQQPDGLWKYSYSCIHKNKTNTKTKAMQPWISLCILRVMKQFSK